MLIIQAIAVATAALPSIQRVEVLSGPAATYHTTEFRVELTASYANPFDPDQVALDLEVTSPSGRKWSTPGFLYRAYRRSLGSGRMRIAYASAEAVRKGAAVERAFQNGEVLTPAGPEEWRVRFTPSEPGAYRLTSVLRDRRGTASMTLPTLEVRKDPKAQGFVRIDPHNPRAFRTSTGSPVFPLGANVCWAGERGTRDYDDWLPEYGKVGANWGRVWLSPCWTTFALEQPEQPGRIDLANAWRIDYVLALAARNGMRLTLCIDSYNVLSDGSNWPEWDRSPFNRANGGPLTNPRAFWTDSAAARLLRNKLRYIVARWGADPAVFAWEQWNEVDGVTGYDRSAVRAWTQRTAAYLRSIDPYRHLVSTSFGGNGPGAGDEAIFALPEIDYSVSHIYDSPDTAAAVVAAQRRLGALGKPHFVAETGADASGSRSDEDPDGLQLHDPLWASIACGSSGGSMLWWWDSYVHPRKLYPLLGSAAGFLKGVDWGAAHLEATPTAVGYLQRPATPERRDLCLEGGPVSWTASDVNRPKTLTLDANGLRGGPVSGILQGVGNHPALHNPVTFQTNLAWPTVFDVIVGNVSGYGGAALTVTVDGERRFDEKFADPDGDRSTADIKRYAGTHAFALPAGRHTFTVENSGQDWVRVDYRFENAAIRRSPPLLAWACAGPDLALAWVRREDRTWRNAIERKMHFDPVPPSELELPDLAPGLWVATVWDTWKGRELSRRLVRVTRGGARVRLPVVSGDVAVKLRRRRV